MAHHHKLLTCFKGLEGYMTYFRIFRKDVIHQTFVARTESSAAATHTYTNKVGKKTD